MKYNIKVGEKYLIGENAGKTLKGTVTGDTTAVYSRFVGEMSAYDFCETADEAPCFDRVTACDYVRGIMERQNYGFYLGDIKLFDAEHEETIAHCKNEENAKIIARILDMDEKDTFLIEEEIFGKDAANEPTKEETCKITGCPNADIPDGTTEYKSCRIKMMADALSQLKAQEWISVEDRLPQERGR